LKIAFRADASPKIGSGHIMRCLALADALRRRGDETCFIARAMPPSLRRRLEQSGHTVVLLQPAPRIRGPDASDPPHAPWLDTDWETDARATLSALAPGACDWLVVDHYALDARWSSRLREKARYILAIDDVADRPLDADLVLDQNLQPDPQTRYLRRLIDPDPRKLLLGPGFALLRPEFSALASRRARRSGPVETLLIAFGGGDDHGAAQRALGELLAPPFQALRLIVVVGGLHPGKADFEALSADHANVDLFVDTAEVAQLMRRSDLAIGAGGGMTYERMCLGLPAITIALEHNQAAPSAYLAERGLSTYLGPIDHLAPGAVAQAVERAIRGEIDLKDQSDAGMQLVDGCGASRVADRLHSVDTSSR
jgi:UDP-2,4-diacetamido-2,4,6-trideoxy-beta-L-altropyranose hydrolase